MAIVNQIQVCGGKIFANLDEACTEYSKCLKEGTDREKINFSIVLSNGEHKSITIRQDRDNQVIAYGDFEGLPNALEWALGKE